jgi:hypothetical protein
MKKLTVLLAGMTLAMTALPAAAGVVITQKQHVTNGKNSRDTEQTISVQGNKQKEVDERRTLIADLDKGMIYIIDPKGKNYYEMEFPPKGPMAQTMAASTAAAMNFKKAGTSREIAGYKCNDYDGGGHAMIGDYTVKECFSTTAPGAQEFSAFEKIWAAKLKSAGATEPAGGIVPEGVPLALDATTKPGSNVPLPGMSPEQKEKISQMMKNRPPVVTSTIVEKIETQKLASDTFTVPAGFTKKDLPATPGMGMKMPAGGMKGLKIGPGVAPSSAASPAAP